MQKNARKQDGDPTGQSEPPFDRLLKRFGAAGYVEGRLLAILPEGAIRFPAFLRFGKDYDPAEIEQVREKFNLGDMSLIHGVALEAGGRAVLLAGPSGIGKSTAVRDLGKSHDIRVLEDGEVLAGVRREDGRLVVIETGRHSKQIAQGISLAARRFMGHRSAFIGLGAGEEDRDEFERTDRRGSSISRWSNAIGVTLTSFLCPKKRTFTPRDTPVSDIICCYHEKDPLQPILLRAGDEPVQIRMEDMASNAGSARPHEFHLPDTEIRKKLRAELGSIVGRLENGG